MISTVLARIYRIAVLFGLVATSASLTHAQCQLIWTEKTNQRIMRLANGAAEPVVFSQAIPDPEAMILDRDGSGSLFVVSESEASIYRMGLSGSNPQKILSSLTSPTALAIDETSNKLYWSENPSSGSPAITTGAIKRSNLDGSNIESVVSNRGAIGALTVLPGSNLLAWTEAVSPDVRVFSAATDGSNIQMLAERIGFTATEFGQQSLVWNSTAITHSPDESTIYWAPTKWCGPYFCSNFEAKIVSLNVSSLAELTLANLPALRVSINFYSAEAPYSLVQADGNLFWSDADLFQDIQRLDINAQKRNHSNNLAYRSHGLIAIAAEDSQLCEQFPASRSNEDATIYRPQTGTWYLRANHSDFSGPNDPLQFQWGLPGDWPIIGDIDGDGLTNRLVWRSASGTWWRNEEPDEAYSFYYTSVEDGENPTQFGLPGDYPVVGDFNGDGSDDLTVWRPSNGNWYLSLSNDTVLTIQWGLPGDYPVADDFDGDGKDDIAVWRPSTGDWYNLQSTKNFSKAAEDIIVRQWGLPQDRPVGGDFDGDGKADLAVWRPSNGSWYVCPSVSSFDCLTSGTATQWGLSKDIPVQLDFDHDNRTDFVVWRPASGTWYYRSSADGKTSQMQWGLPNDIPIGSDIKTMVEKTYPPRRR